VIVVSKQESKVREFNMAITEFKE